MRGKRAVLGTFDGVHIGHRALFSRAAELEREDALTPIAMVIHRDGELISSLSERERLLLSVGAKEVCIMDLADVKDKSADEFIEYIKEEYGVSAAVCGYDFRFGRGREGDARRLGELLPVEVVPEQRIGDITVSSTAVRQALKEGRVEDAALLLGRVYSVTGAVTEGKQLGRTRGYPTANIPYPAGRVVCRAGVYFTHVVTDGGRYNAISNLGVCPTVGGSETVIESYLLDYEGTLYGESITVEFLHFHRDERRFPDIEALYEQISADRKAAEDFFKI